MKLNQQQKYLTLAQVKRQEDTKWKHDNKTNICVIERCRHCNFLVCYFHIHYAVSYT